MIFLLFFLLWFPYQVFSCEVGEVLTVRSWCEKPESIIVVWDDRWKWHSCNCAPGEGRQYGHTCQAVYLCDVSVKKSGLKK